MQKKHPFLTKSRHWLVAVLAVCCLPACDLNDEAVNDPWGPDNFGSAFTPILMDREAMIAAVAWQEPREINNPGKIYYHQEHIFLNERYKGVHVIDNGNPNNPRQVGFISVPGTVDLAAKGSVLYLDNATDLIAVAIGTPGSIRVTQRLENVFPDLAPPDALQVPTAFTKAKRPVNTVIVGWERKK